MEGSTDLHRTDRTRCRSPRRHPVDAVSIVIDPVFDRACRHAPVDAGTLDTLRTEILRVPDDARERVRLPTAAPSPIAEARCSVAT